MSPRQNTRNEAGNGQVLNMAGSNGPDPELLFRAFLDAAPVGFCCFDREFRYVSVNKTLADINGLAVEEHLGRTVIEVLPELGPAVQGILEQVLSTGEPLLNIQVAGETRVAPGTTKHWLADYHPVRGKSGRVDWICVYLREVTEHRHAKESLQEANSNHQVIFDNIPCQVYAKDVAGRCFLYNAACEKVWGLHRESVLGRTPRELFPGPVADQMDANHAKVLSTGSVVTTKVALPTVLGSRDFLSVLFPLKNLSGELSGVGGVCLDVTEHQAREKELLVYRHIVSSVEDPLCMIGPDYRYQEASPGYIRACGLSKEDVIGRHVSEVLGQEIFESVHKPLLDRGLAGETACFESWMDFPIHGRRYLMGTVTPCREEEGRVIGVVVSTRDATERRQAEEALRVSEERFRIIADYTYDWESWFGRDGRLLWVNPAVERLTCRSPAECLGMVDYPLAMVHQDDRSIVESAIEQGLAGTAGNDLAFRCLDTAGEIRWATISWNPILNKEGEVASLRTSVRDVNLRHRIEEAQQQSEALFRAVVHSAPMGIGITDGNGVLMECNAVLGDMVGFTREELLGGSFERFTHPEDLEMEWGFIRKVWSGEQPNYRMEKRFLHQDGHEVWVDLVGTTFEVHPGGKRFGMAFAQDITERKGNERSLCNSQRLLATTQRIAKVGGWEWDVERREMAWTDETYRIHGMVPGAVAEGSPEHIRQSLSCYDPKDRPIVEQAFQRCVEEGLPYSMELPFTTLEGRRLHIKTMAEAVRGGGRIVKVQGNIIDVTELKQAEEALRLSEERFRLANLATHDVIWDWDIVQDTQRWNAEGAIVFGWHDIVERPQNAAWWVERVHPDDRQRVEASFFVVVNDPSDVFWENEYRFLRADGEYAHVMDRGYVLRDSGGQAVRMIGAMRDITRRKRMELDLRASEANFRSFFASLDDMAVVATPAGDLLFANDAVGRKLGFSPEDLAGMNLLALYREVSPAADHPAPPSPSHWMELKRAEAAAVRQDGHLMPVSCSVVGGDWDGKDCVFVVAKDLSEVQEATQRFERVFSANPALMAITSLPERRLHDVNEAWLATLGYEKSEVIGKSSRELGIIVDPAEQDALARLLGLEGRASNFELQIRRKDGTVLDGLFSGEVISINGKRYLLTVMVDITERKRHEKEREDQARALKEMNTALRVILDQRERDREALQEQMAYNLVHLVEPYLDRIVSAAHNPVVDRYVEAIRRNLEDAAVPLAKILGIKHGSLTGNEIRVASLLRQGKTGKDISRLLNISKHTVDYYRKNIRRKLGIQGRTSNLTTMLDMLAKDTGNATDSPER